LEPADRTLPPGRDPVTAGRAALAVATGALAGTRLLSCPLSDAWLDVPLYLLLLATWTLLRPRSAGPAASVTAALLLAVYLRLQVPLLAGLFAP
jgi:hypothetical protein